MTVYQVLIGAELDYPRIDYSSPRNRFDWLELTAFVRGEIESGPYDIAVHEKRRRPLGAVSLAPGYVAVPPHVAAAFVDAGASLVLRPIRVNGREYVSMHCTAVRSVLDLEESIVELFGPSRIPQVHEHVWLPQALEQPLFTTPETHSHWWAAEPLVSVIEELALPGLRCIPSGSMSTRDVLTGSTPGATPSPGRSAVTVAGLGLRWAPVSDVQAPHRPLPDEETLVGTDSAMLALVDAQAVDAFYDANDGYIDGRLVMDGPIVTHPHGVLIGTGGDGVFPFEVVERAEAVGRIEIEVYPDDEGLAEERPVGEFTCESGTLVLAAPESLESFELVPSSEPVESRGGWAVFRLSSPGTVRLTLSIDETEPDVPRRVVVEWVPN